jgi:membrane fusion protein, multidrug efflux system
MPQKTSSKPLKPVLLLVAAAMLGACSERPAPVATVRPVYVSAVQPAAAADLRSFTASVRARVETDLAFRTGGKVVQRLVDVGTQVKAGQVLARLDNTDYTLSVQAADDQVRAARVDAEQAAADEARFRRLAAEGSAGSADYERQKARADAAAARLDQAQRQAALARNRDAYATLVAPYAGVVTGIRTEQGQVVAEGQPVLSLARDGEREIVADIPEDWVARVRTASAHANSWAEEPSSQSALLRLRELSPLANAQGRTFRARFAATASSREALAAMPLGSTVHLRLASAVPGERGVQIPVSALVKGSGPAGVWILNAAGSGLVFTPVKLLATGEATLRVTGLSAGQRVVSVGAQKLDAKLAVRAVERPSAAAAAEVARAGS